MAPLNILKSLQGTRWRIAWSLLKSGPQSVTELADHLNLYRDACSRQLSIMRKSGVVTYEKVNHERIYRLTNSTAFTYFVSYLQEMVVEKWQKKNILNA